MKNKHLLLVVLLLAVPFIYLAGLWPHLPERVPLHVTFTGHMDTYGTKNDLVLLTVALGFVALVVYSIVANLHRLSKQAPVANKSRMQKIALIVVLFITLVQCWLLYVAQKGVLNDSIKFVLAAVGLLVALIGNYLPNLKPNYFAGFRLPWTLHDEENWRKTHQLAGRTWFAGGLVCMTWCLLLPLKTALVSCGILFLVLLVLPAVYSYRLSHRVNHTV